MKHILSSAQKQLIQLTIAALLLVGCIAVLLPFTGTLLFAVVICVTTAPMRNRLLRLAAFQNPEFYRAQAIKGKADSIPIPVQQCCEQPD